MAKANTKTTEKKDTKTKVKTAVTKKSVEPKGKLTKSLRPGVNVQVLLGKDKGKTGKVISVDRTKMRVKIEGVAEAVDYQKNAMARTGEKTVKPMSIHISNVKLV